MTDKEQIIIDGVDVSECAYFDYENEGTKECYAYSNECEANNCYFKQLARKTQECEKTKTQLNILIIGDILLLLFIPFTNSLICLKTICILQILNELYQILRGKNDK